jgi:hypothetical protein
MSHITRISSQHISPQTPAFLTLPLYLSSLMCPGTVSSSGEALRSGPQIDCSVVVIITDTSRLHMLTDQKKIRSDRTVGCDVRPARTSFGRHFLAAVEKCFAGAAL